MTDRELLELAAKAAGIGGNYECLECLIPHESIVIRDKNGIVLQRWNPLADDGDALRLMVKLSMDVDCTDNENHVSNTWAMSQLSNSSGVAEYHGDDPYAATRRAIVRAAAELGTQQLQAEPN